MTAPATVGRGSRWAALETTDLVDAAAIIALVALPLWSFHGSFGGVAFFMFGLVGILAAAGLFMLARTLDWTALATTVALVVGYPVIGAIAVFRYQNLLGFIPTPTSLYETVDLSFSGWKVLVTTEPPVGGVGGLYVLTYGVGYIGAAIMLACAQRRLLRFSALFVPFAILGWGIYTGTSTPAAPLVLAIGTVGGAITWLSWHEEARRPSVDVPGRRSNRSTMAALYVMAGLVAGVGLAALAPITSNERTVWRDEVVPPFDPRVYPSPLAGYRQYVKLGPDIASQDGEDRPMFTVSGLPLGVSVRLATMDSYDGLVWQVSSGDPANPTLDDSASFQRVGTNIRPDQTNDGEFAEVVIVIDQYSDVWIPTVGEVVSLTFEGSAAGTERDRALQRSFRYNRATDTAATPLGLQPGDRYRMEVLLPTPPELAQADIDMDRRVGPALAVPSLTDAFASPVLLEIDSPAERLDTVRSEMYRLGVYSDGDAESGHIAARAGHSAGRLAEFTNDYPQRPLLGNAEQYASAYALLFRQIDSVPTRVAMGFEADRASTDEPVTIYQTDVEAWPEVPTSDGGWMWIDPTPPRDQIALTQTAPQQPDPDYRTQKPEPPAVVEPEFENAATVEGEEQEETDLADSDDEREEATKDDDSRGVTGGASSLVVASVLPLLLVALCIGLILLVKLVRRSVRRRRGDPELRVVGGWNEVEDYSLDLRRPIEPNATRRENAETVGGPAVALAERIDASVWSGDELDDQKVAAHWAEVTAALSQMRSELDWWTRFRAAISLRSLTYRSRRSP